MKHIVFSTLITVISFFTPVIPTFGQQTVLDHIVAVIDNEVILNSDIMQATQMFLVQSQVRPTQREIQQLQQQFLDQLIDNRIIIASARRDSIEIPVDQIDNAVRAVTGQLIERWGSQEALEQALAQEGFSMRDYLRLLRKQEEDKLLLRRLEEQRFGTIQVSGKEVEEFYHAYKDSLPEKPVIVEISHIMMSVRVDADLEEQLRARVVEIQDLISRGADFAELAKQYSEDLATAQNGGDLGWFSRGTFVSEFEEAAFQLQPGGLSDIVRTPYGFHLIKMETRDGSRARVRHILIQVPTTAEDAQRTIETLKFLRQRLLNGDETFEEAARKYSEDIESSLDGGALGEFRLETLQPQYRTEIERMAVNEISMPVEISEVENTYHLIRLDSRKGGGRLNLSDDWDAVANLAKQKKWQDIRREWINDLRKEVYIEVRGLAAAN